MTIKQWVVPPQSLSLSELQAEFGCNPIPSTSTTTNAPQPIITSSTTSTSTSTSTSTTLPPNVYKPTISIKGLTFSRTSDALFTRPSIDKGPAYQFIIQSAPPGASFAMTITYASGSPVVINNTIPISGEYESNPDSSSTWPLGALSVSVVFTLLLGQTMPSGTTIVFSTSVQLPSTTSSTSTTTTTLMPVFAGLCRTTYNNYPQPFNVATPNWSYDTNWFTLQAPIARTIDTALGVINFAPFVENFSVEWVGYFVPASTGSHIFYIDAVDDIAAIWIGSEAESGYTLSNAHVKSLLSSTPVGGTPIPLNAGVRYFIRIHYLQGLNFKTFSLSWSGPGQAKTDNFAGRIFHSTCTPISYSAPTSTTTSTTTTTLATVTGQAFLVNTGSITTLQGSATLPGAPVKLMFRLIGAGGSGGGADSLEGVGGSGGGGGLILGEVILPDTGATPKTLKAGIGAGGLPAKSINIGGDLGRGGIGFSFPSGAGYSASGGNGAPQNPSGRSGAGGGGGGASALFVEVGSSLVGIASAGGGGGGGGGSYRIPAADAQNSAGTPIAYQSFSSMDGFSGSQIAGVDGGGGGGGGGGRGAAGISATGDTYPTATGGRAGIPVQNTSSGLSVASWNRFEYHQPPATMASGNWARITNYAWSQFMNAWAVGDVNDNLVGTKTQSFPLYFPVTGSYGYTIAADNTGSFSVDGVTIATLTDNFATVNGYSGTFTATAGMHNFSITFTNGGGGKNNPGGIALIIHVGSSSNNDVIFTTEDLFRNRNTVVDRTLAKNWGVLGSGGQGSDSDTKLSIEGTKGAVAVYWTTNLTETWDANKIPQFPDTTVYIHTFPGTPDISSEGTAFYNFYNNGYAYGSNGVWIKWAEPAGSNIGDLYDIRFDGVSGDLGYANPSNTYSAGGYWYSQPGVWQSIGSIPRVVGTIGGTAVITVQIRRRSDFVVVFSRNITFTVTAIETPPSDGGGGAGE